MCGPRHQYRALDKPRLGRLVDMISNTGAGGEAHAAGLSASVQVTVIPDKGHMVMAEAANEVNRRIAAFLN